jgi:GntR family transcriptional regulator
VFLYEAKMEELNAVSEHQWKRIDRENPVPLYIQIMQRLRSQIEGGIWAPGFLLPGEAEMCKTYNVSRIVIRQALGELANQGLIVRLRGKGTFVKETKIGEGLVQKLTGFYHDMVERGYKPITHVIDLKVISADSRIAQNLQISEGEPVLRITRKRSVEDTPLVLVTTYLPYRLCKGLENEDLQEQSLYETLERKYGLLIVSGRRTVEAVAASEHEAQILEIKRGDPLLMLHSISYLKDGTPIEYYHAVHRGDRTRFEVELVRYKEIGSNKKSLEITAMPPHGGVLESEDNARLELGT